MLRLSRIIALSYIAICLVAVAGSALIGPLGYAPFRLISGPTRPPIQITIWYGTEKKEWLEAAKQSFDQTNPTLNGHPIHIQLVGLGSREMAERVNKKDWRNEPAPTAISPASSLWLDALNVPIIRTGADAVQPLVNSPVVVAGWEDRSTLLWPNGPSALWPDLEQALTKDGGWAAQGGEQIWGPVKFGHTSPLTSNSGTQMLLLMAYDFAGKTNGLSVGDIDNPEFKNWLANIEGSVSSVGESTGSFMNDVVLSGPSKYDFIVVYENLVLQNMAAAQMRNGYALHLYYPPATLLSDHPFAILDESITSADERAAARKFRDFLRSNAMQQLALTYGFRPVDPSVDINGGDPTTNPFKKYAAQGIQVELPPQVAIPPTDVLNKLLDVWQSVQSQ